MIRLLPLSLTTLLLCVAVPAPSQASVARSWNEDLLNAIRIDFPAPTVHARNLFHLSVGMYDAWATYDPTAVGYLHNEAASATNIAAARNEAVSYAAYTILTHRLGQAPTPLSVNPGAAQAIFDTRMAVLGYDKSVTSSVGNSPSAVGIRAANAVIAHGTTDGANEANLYLDPNGYTSVNDPMILSTTYDPSDLINPNRWQPLAFDFAFTQNGLIADQVQSFIGSHWGNVTSFCLTRDSANDVYLDPGMPPQLRGATDADFKQNNVDVIRFSSQLDPDLGVTLDISPAVHGNSTLGLNDGTGHGATNPVSGLNYGSNIVNLADYGRVLAEFWADGPESETPPGHWNVLANEVCAHPATVKRVGGTGPIVDDLEWDVKLYFALNAAVHDAAVAAWDAKEAYDYVRPISSIRFMGALGQSTDNTRSSYHVDGLPLTPGVVEEITLATVSPGQKHSHLAAFVGKIAIFAWGGEPADPETQYTGSEWILAERWLPYQRDTFVTPAFAGYVSGHSTFSRAAAEVLTSFTGSPYFPGGLGTHLVIQDTLEFEKGPSQNVILQWATYYDAADEAGLSRLYGGIHVSPDDGPGRIMGSTAGICAVNKAYTYFDGSVLGAFKACVTNQANGDVYIEWPTVAGFSYKVQTSMDLSTWSDITSYTVGLGTSMNHTDSSAITNSACQFYRVIRQP